MSPIIYQQNPAETGYWATVFDIIPYPIYIVAVDTLNLVAVNRTMGEKVRARVGSKCYESIYQQEAPCIFCKIGELMQKPQPIGSSIVFEHFNDIDDCWYQLQETLMAWHDGRIAKYSIAVDISALKEVQNALAEAHAQLALKNRQLEKASITDYLTGLYNRRRIDTILEAEVERAVRHGRSLSIILVDVDKFKAINDVHGHPTGDRVLVALADVMRRRIRKIDSIGRWGGEEFVVVCPETQLAGACALAESLRQAIENTELAIGTRTASFGVTEWRAEDTSIDMIGRADKALYRAKANGRNRIETA